ncbi:MAG: response regulator, partial [Phycisphaerae bacterium]|nr:response regulator [Phycisphaerae bacterium]
MSADESEIILVVEDDTLMREALQEILENRGFRVLEAKHGQDALLIMSEVMPDLIVSDISMPLMDGLTFFRKVRERSGWVSIPFIFLTARGERQQILEGKDMGAEEYLVKPVPPDELLRAIRARLSRSRELQLAQIQASYEASLTMLANAIEVRDEYTRGHVERVRNYAVIIAQEISWEKKFIETIRFGAILHDIGKIHVRESVLRKKTPLTNEEWHELSLHPVVGAEMLKDIPYLVPAIPAVRHHHERWDGKGYPDGLAGSQIPLSARIIAVADALDAITTDRPYRMALNSEFAYEDLDRKAGINYDPEIIKVFQKLWG